MSTLVNGEEREENRVLFSFCLTFHVTRLSNFYSAAAASVRSRHPVGIKFNKLRNLIDNTWNYCSCKNPDRSYFYFKLPFQNHLNVWQFSTCSIPWLRREIQTLITYTCIYTFLFFSLITVLYFTATQWYPIIRPWQLRNVPSARINRRNPGRSRFVST